TGEQAQSLHTAVLFATLEQHLHADADAQQGFFLGHLVHNLVPAQRAQLADAIANRPHAGQDYAVGIENLLRLTGDDDLARTGVLQRLGNRVQVAHAVIDDGDRAHLQRTLGRGDAIAHARVDFHGHAQGATEGLEHGLDLVVGVDATQVVDVQGHQGMVDEALEELLEQVHIEAADDCAGIGHVHLQAGTAGEVQRHARQRLVHGDVGVPVAAQPLLVAHGLGKGLAQGDADIFHGVVVVDVEVAATFDMHVDQAVPGYLVQHVLEEGNADIEVRLAGTVQVDFHFDLGFRRVALDTRPALRHGHSPQIF